MGCRKQKIVFIFNNYHKASIKNYFLIKKSKVLIPEYWNKIRWFAKHEIVKHHLLTLVPWLTTWLRYCTEFDVSCCLRCYGSHRRTLGYMLGRALGCFHSCRNLVTISLEDSVLLPGDLAVYYKSQKAMFQQVKQLFTLSKNNTYKL